MEYRRVELMQTLHKPIVRASFPRDAARRAEVEPAERWGEPVLQTFPRRAVL